MKRYILSVLLICSAYAASSQVAFGIFGGPQASRSKYTIRNQKQDNEFKYGFQLGASMKVPFENRLYFSPAVFYSMKGYKVKFSQFVFPPSNTAVDNDTRMHTFEVAAMLQYDFGQGPGHVFIKGGPSLDFQLFGKEKFNQAGGQIVDRNMRYDYNEYGRYAANMLVQFGYESGNGIMFFAQYSHGMGNLNNADGGPEIKHRVFGISIGKFLNRKPALVYEGGHK